RKTLAAVALALTAIVLATQSPSDAAGQDANAEEKSKKGFKKQFEAVPETKKDDKAVDAKPAPTVVNTPAAPARPIPTASLARLIDQAIDAQLAAAMIRPSPESSDGEFLRRVYLDITGVVPTAEKAAAFLDDRSADKRAKVIDELLESANYGRRMADIWTRLMYPLDSDNRFVGKGPQHEWLPGPVNKKTTRHRHALQT